MVDRNQLARHKFNQRMAMKRMGIDPDKNKIVFGNDTDSGKKEQTEEEKYEMERKRKEEEERQKVARIQSLEKSIQKKQVANNLLEKTISRMKAERDVLQNVDLQKESNEWKRKSISANIGSINLEIEQMGADFDRDRSDLKRMQDDLAGLKAKGESE